RIAAPISLWGRLRSSGSSSSAPVASVGSVAPAASVASVRLGLGADEAGGAGSWAVYPVFSTTAISSSALTPGDTWMLAFSVASLTEALTPSSRFSFFSTRAAQLAQVIPPTSRSISSRAGTGWESMVIEHSDRLPQRPHHIPLGGMKGRGGAEPPRDRRPRPRPHPPYPIPHTP